MADPQVSPGTLSILVKALADRGLIVVPIMLGSLAPLDPLIAQLLVAGYIRLAPQGNDPALPADSIAYAVTEAGRRAIEGAKGIPPE